MGRGFTALDDLRAEEANTVVPRCYDTRCGVVSNAGLSVAVRTIEQVLAARADYSSFLVHLTRKQEKLPARKVLKKILQADSQDRRPADRGAAMDRSRGGRDDQRLRGGRDRGVTIDEDRGSSRDGGVRVVEFDTSGGKRTWR